MLGVLSGLPSRDERLGEVKKNENTVMYLTLEDARQHDWFRKQTVLLNDALFCSFRESVSLGIFFRSWHNDYTRIR